jgi:outer membrane protein assembly factor BamB
LNGVDVEPIARLTDRSGSTRLRGVFLVSSDSNFQSVKDLSGRSIALAPPEDEESNSAALKFLQKTNFDVEPKIEVKASLEEAAYALADGEADAAVVSDYLPPLLEGCGKVEKDSLRLLETTAPVEFITVYALESASEEKTEQLASALLKLSENQALCDKLESRFGFLSMEQPDPTEWTTWRGPQGNGTSPWMPQRLPETPLPLWTAPLTGPAMAGVAATADYVLVADKNQELTEDVLRCFSSRDGEELWTVRYPAAEKIEYTNAPRAMPIVVAPHVYFQGAGGDLRCVKLESGEAVWKRNLVKEFNTELLNWGSSSPPLITGELLITNPGAEDASLVALDRFTGETVWKTAGNAAAYSAFQIVTVGDTKQIVGYDAASLAGWDLQTGKQLWTMIPPQRSDFNVGTPLILGQQILLATENNGTRLYAFDDDSRLKTRPVAENEDPAPDTCSPVAIDGRVFLTAYGELYCLDLNDELKTIWVEADDMFYEHSSLIAGNHHLLIYNTVGDLLLVRTDTDKFETVSQLRPFGDREFESMSYPALVPGRLYLRSDDQLMALPLPEPQPTVTARTSSTEGN